jgi:hypothetical protein
MGTGSDSEFLMCRDFYLPLPAPWDRVLAVVWDDYPDYAQADIRCIEILARQAHGKHFRIILRIRGTHLKLAVEGHDTPHFWMWKPEAVTTAFYEVLQSSPIGRTAISQVGLDLRQSDLDGDRVPKDTRGLPLLYEELRPWIIRYERWQSRLKAKGQLNTGAPKLC